MNGIGFVLKKVLLSQWEEAGEWVTVSRKIPLSDALSLRSRRSGTKFAAPYGTAH